MAEVLNETVATHAPKAKVKAGNKMFDLIQNNAGNIISYTLDALKRIGLSARGMRDDDGNALLRCFSYNGKYRFELVDMKTKTEYPVWASEALKEELEKLESYKESKNGNPYYKVPEKLVSFYEVFNEETKEVGIIVGKRSEGDDTIIL